MDELEIELAIASSLTARGEKVTLAETSAGGLTVSRLMRAPGSSAWLAGGVVAYSAAARERWLGMLASDVPSAGIVSPEGALALARAARNALGTAWGASESGIAGPQTGRRSPKPPGLAYVAVSGERAGETIERVGEVSTGVDDRDSNRAAFAEAMLRLLQECVGRP